jgi:hypothetical protein
VPLDAAGMDGASAEGYAASRLVRYDFSFGRKGGAAAALIESRSSVVDICARGRFRDVLEGIRLPGGGDNSTSERARMDASPPR